MPASTTRRQPEGARLRRRQADALCLLRRARRAASPCGKLIVATDAAGAGEARQHPGAAPRPTASTTCGCCTAPRRWRWSRRSPASPALLSPSTGIIDSHALMLALQGDAEDAGAIFALPAPVLRRQGRPSDGIELDVGGAEPMALRCRSCRQLRPGSCAAAGRASTGRHAAGRASRTSITPRAIISP